jgi:hypothetical protein
MDVDGNAESGEIEQRYVYMKVAIVELHRIDVAPEKAPLMGRPGLPASGMPAVCGRHRGAAKRTVSAAIVQALEPLTIKENRADGLLIVNPLRKLICESRLCLPRRQELVYQQPSIAVSASARQETDQ